MKYRYFLDFLPQWALFLITIALIAVAMESGFRLGAWRRRRPQQENEKGDATIYRLHLAGGQKGVPYYGNITFASAVKGPLDTMVIPAYPSAPYLEELLRRTATHLSIYR